PQRRAPRPPPTPRTSCPCQPHRRGSHRAVLRSAQGLLGPTRSAATHLPQKDDPRHGGSRSQATSTVTSIPASAKKDFIDAEHAGRACSKRARKSSTKSVISSNHSGCTGWLP